jgi:hypothetical protein
MAPGIRDTVRVLKVGINTVIRTLKNLVLETVNHSINTTEVIIAPEIDELCLMYRVNPNNGGSGMP